MQSIDPNQFANQFFGTANKMLEMQMTQTARSLDHVSSVSKNGMALIDASANQANMYYYGLANQQTQMANQLGQQYAAIAKRASKNAGNVGFLGALTSLGTMLSGWFM